MWGKILIFLLKLASSKTAEVAIGVAVNHLLKSKDSGIGKDLATTMVNGIVASTKNPITKTVADTAMREFIGKL